jgi:hypothetical protein
MTTQELVQIIAKVFKAVVANLQWKILALLLAIVSWSVVVGEPELVTSRSVPIFYKNLPRDLEIGSDVPATVHLEIRGPAGKLTPPSLAETAVFFDLGSVNAPGERTFTVTGESINLPLGVQLWRAVPSQLRLRFQRIETKSVRVEIRAGAPPSGYAVTSQTTSPRELTILGPEDHVKLVSTAQTDPIDLSSTVGRAEFHVHAYVADPQIRFQGSPIVTVRVDVEKKAGH